MRRFACGLLLCLVAITGSAQARPPAHASIVGGEAAGGGWPFMVFVAVEEGSHHGSCSGTLVAPNLVLTAGHCLVDVPSNTVYEAASVHVHLGSSNWVRGGHWYQANALYPDPAYRVASTYRDAGLIELPGPVPYPTISLAERPVTAGTGVLMLGWGTTSSPTSGEGQPSEELMLGDSVVQSAAYCSMEVPRLSVGSELCTVDYPDEKTSLCFGDSGGPTLVTTEGGPVEVGINDAVIFGSEGIPCSPLKPDTEIRANVEAKWVYQMAALHPPELPTLTEPEAVVDARQVLMSGPLRGHFAGHQEYRVDCSQAEASKRRCEVEWTSGKNSYSGTVTVYLVYEAGEPVWKYRYRVSWVRKECLEEGDGHCHVSRLSA